MYCRVAVLYIATSSPVKLWEPTRCGVHRVQATCSIEVCPRGDEAHGELWLCGRHDLARLRGRTVMWSYIVAVITSPWRGEGPRFKSGYDQSILSLSFFSFIAFLACQYRERKDFSHMSCTQHTKSNPRIQKVHLSQVTKDFWNARGFPFQVMFSMNRRIFFGKNHIISSAYILKHRNILLTETQKKSCRTPETPSHCWWSNKTLSHSCWIQKDRSISPQIQNYYRNPDTLSHCCRIPETLVSSRYFCPSP